MDLFQILYISGFKSLVVSSVLSDPGLCVTLLPSGDHEPLRLQGGSGRGVGGMEVPKRRRPTVQQLKANSRMVHPEYLSQQDLYKFSRLDPGQFQVPS